MGRPAWRPQVPQGSSMETRPASVCKAAAGIQRNLLNIKHQAPAGFFFFHTFLSMERLDLAMHVGVQAQWFYKAVCSREL